MWTHYENDIVTEYEKIAKVYDSNGGGDRVEGSIRNWDQAICGTIK